MAQFIRKAHAVEAVQWWRHGDHPEILAILVLQQPAPAPCSKCGHGGDLHGLLVDDDCEYLVCPGTWIVICPEEYIWLPSESKFAKLVSQSEFSDQYEPVKEEAS